MTETFPTPFSSARSLRTLYSVRTGFSVAWALSLGILGASNPSVAAVLLAIYPLWDAACSVVDARANPGEARGPQTLNAVLSTAVGVAVIVALGRGVPETLTVFGAWAIVSGAIQLFLALRRRAALGGQWPMILSGGISTLAGVKMILLAHAPKAGLISLAGYATVGALFYAASAFRLKNTTSN